jgi:hypothetical protein
MRHFRFLRKAAELVRVNRIISLNGALAVHEIFTILVLWSLCASPKRHASLPDG